MKTIQTLKLAVLVSCLFFPSLPAFGQASSPSGGMLGARPLADGRCREGEPIRGLCEGCGLAGEPACPSQNPVCRDMKTFGWRVFGNGARQFCGRTVRPDGGPVTNGFPGAPPTSGGSCQVGNFEGGAGLCVVCGLLGQEVCTSTWLKPCDQGVPLNGRCVRGIGNAYDLQGIWITEVGPGYRVEILAKNDTEFEAHYININNTDVFEGRLHMNPTPVTVTVQQRYNRPNLKSVNATYNFTSATVDQLTGTGVVGGKLQKWGWERAR
jgi:hypothetical protein